jgi:hypothetical protein
VRLSAVVSQIALGIFGAGPLAAQAILNPGPCDGLVVSDVTVDAQPPDLSGFTRRWRALEFVNDLHVTSDPDMIRRFLILKVGDRCTELRRAESERILRAQPFLADATVLAVPDGVDGVRLQVITIDEFSVIGAISATGSSPFVKRLKAGDGNFLGEGVHVSAEWADGVYYRDRFGGRFTDYQLFGRPYQVTLEGARETLGDRWASEASHPFLTDLQRAAWRVSGGESRGYFGFLQEHAPTTSLEYRRSYADIGGVIRIGEPGRLSLFGASLSRERELPGTLPVFVTDSGLYADPSPTLIGRYAGNRTARINALWGVRNVHFVRVTGFDALRATQDLRRGFQLGVLAGRSLSVLGSSDDDIFVAADLYAGWADQNSFIGLQFLGEGRQNYDENHWDGILGSGRAASYVKFSSAHTLITSFEYSGGWVHRTPFQLRLGDDDGGVRGYGDSRVGGNQRGVVRVEERWSWRTMGRMADIGWALFGDAGKMWAGDVPFGVDTPIRYGVGVGFLAALPARSRRLWRLDFAVPLTADAHAGWEVRLTSSDLTRMFWREPGDVARSRERFVPSSIFNWP